MRSCIRISVRSLLRNSQRWRIATSPSTALSSAHSLVSHSSILQRTSVNFSTHQIESDITIQSSSEPSSSETGTEMAVVNDSEAIDKLCNSNAAEQAEHILRAMEEQQTYLPSKDYLKVLKCYVERNQVEEAYNLLLNMKQTPHRDCFPLVANALIERNKLSKAKQLLYKNMDRGIATTACFNTMISAYIRQNRRRQAVALTHKMDWYARNGHPEAKPDKMTMTSLMQLLANRGHFRDAQALLERMWTSPERNMRPDAVTYSLVFSAFANAQKTDPDVAYDLLQVMKERYEDQRELTIRPNTVVYNSFLSVLANAGDGERAEQVLQEMEVDPDLKPDVVSYGIVLTAWKNASRGDKAETFLWKIPNPDRTCFSITIAALAKNGEAHRAEAILRHMISRNMEVNTLTYTAVLNAWANAKDDPDAFENAKRVLQEMGQRTNIVIDTAVYNTFLKAIENSFMLDSKVNAVRSVLIGMKRSKDDASRPNGATYRQAIYAVASTRGNDSVQKKALEFAMQIYQDRKNLQGKEQIDTKIHSVMLEACGKLSPRGVNGDEIAEQVFENCCKLGIVTSLHTRLLEKAASDELLKKIFKTDTLDQRIFNSIPKSWSRKRRGNGGKRRS